MNNGLSTFLPEKLYYYPNIPPNVSSFSIRPIQNPRKVRRGGALVAPASDDTDFSGNRGGGVRRGDGCRPSIPDDTEFSGNRGGGVLPPGCLPESLTHIDLRFIPAEAWANGVLHDGITHILSDTFNFRMPLPLGLKYFFCVSGNNMPPIKDICYHAKHPALKTNEVPIDHNIFWFGSHPQSQRVLKTWRYNVGPPTTVMFGKYAVTFVKRNLKRHLRVPAVPRFLPDPKLQSQRQAMAEIECLVNEYICYFRVDMNMLRTSR